MAKTKEGKDPGALVEVAESIYAGIISVFICVILAVFPLYHQDYYFDILKAKYKFYWIAALTFLIVCLLVSLVFLFVDFQEYRGANTKRFFGRFKPSNLKKQPLVYKALVIFWLFSLISTLQSDYLYESFWGNEGRFSGFFLMTLYVLTTIVIGKLGRMKRWYLDVFLFVSLGVCIFGITDYFHMDLLGWKANVSSSQVDLFTSTMGNVNTYTAYVALVLGISCGLFVKEKNPLRSLWYFIVSAAGFFAMITGQSDNAYLSLGIMFAVLPFFLFGDAKELSRYVTLAAAFFTSIAVLARVNVVMADRVLGFTGIFDLLADSRWLFVVIALLWALAAFLYVWGRKMPDGSTGKIGGKFRLVWSCLIAAAVCVVLFVLFDANFGGHPERYGPVAGYVVFNDSWGTNRGFCWRIGWEAYKEQPFLHQMFGYGPDTYGILTWGFREESIQKFNVYYESAHNEYLQYLVTIGPLALASYLVFLGSSFVSLGRTIKKYSWVLALLTAVVCYNTQAIVNINLPIATPFMWLFLAMGLALCREAQAAGE